MTGYSEVGVASAFRVKATDIPSVLFLSARHGFCTVQGTCRMCRPFQKKATGEESPVLKKCSGEAGIL